MSNTCVLDFETRSAVKLGRGGTNAHNYAKHPTTELWLGRYGFEDDPDTIYHIGFQPQCPPQLREHVENGGIICAHNAGFEWAIWNLILVPRYGWPELDVKQMSDTAARGARLGLPRDLERMAPALNLTHKKDMEGSNKMKAMAKPRKVFDLDFLVASETEVRETLAPFVADPLRYTILYAGAGATVYEWWAVDERIERLGTYCDDDYLTQMELHLNLPELPEKEWQIWQLTMQSNIRGHILDLDFIRRARTIIDTRLKEYAHQLQRRTGGQVKGHTDLNGMKAFCNDNGVEVDSLAAGIVTELVASESTPDPVKDVLQVRMEAGKSSVAKYPAMETHADDLGVAHDQLVYYGAQATGRWSALGYQLHNLPARGAVGFEEAEWCIEQIKKADDPRDTIQLIEVITGMSVIEVLSMCLRGAIQARPGHRIVCADFSNIEGRKAAWLGGEIWKLDAFRLFDAGKGPDLYKVTAAEILGITPEDVDKVQRNVMGKVSELALGFGGGVGAYVSMGANYGVNMENYVQIIHDTLTDYWDEALENHDLFGKENNTMSKPAWVACESIKLAWRAKHPGIVQAWRDTEDAAISAVLQPGKPFYSCDKKLAMLAKSINGKMFLLMRLPSGRCIHYANVKVKEAKTKWGTTKPQLSFDKVEQGRVRRAGTWGGDIFQSAVQGGARDLMAEGWLNTEAAGYRGLFSVHDELASEQKIELINLAEYEALLCDLPAYADGCPVTATGYVSDRFRKD